MFLIFPIQNVIYSYCYSRHLSVFDPTLLLIFLRSTASALVVLEDSKSTALWNEYVIFSRNHSLFITFSDDQHLGDNLA